MQHKIDFTSEKAPRFNFTDVYDKRYYKRYLHLNYQASREVQRIRVNACNGSLKETASRLSFDLKKPHYTDFSVFLVSLVYIETSLLFNVLYNRTLKKGVGKKSSVCSTLD